MGRRSKHFTLAERQAAAKHLQHVRRQTPQYVLSFYICTQLKLYRYKELSKGYRHNAYWKAHGRQGSTPSSLPPALLKQALQALPINAPLFSEASKDADRLDETGLEVWDTGPPYATPSDVLSETEGEIKHTERLVEVMHGRYVRMAREVWADRQSKPNYDFQLALAHAVEEWEIGRIFVEEDTNGHREHAMAKVWLQWLAREAYSIDRHIKTL